MDRMSYRSQVMGAALKPPGMPVLEEDTSGKVNTEIEHMFYAKIDAPRYLLNADSLEIQEQWGLWHDKTDKNAGRGSVRVRKTIRKQIRDGEIQESTEEIEYIMTTKIKTASGDALEISIPTTEDNFKAFKILAESGMVKHRFNFPIPGTEMKWEVDAFIRPGEDVLSCLYLDTCKIDLEVKDKQAPIPAFPEGISDAFVARSGDETTAEQSAIIETMERFLSLPNPIVTPMYKGV